MIADAWTVTWREWRDYLAQNENWRKTGRSLLLLFIALVVAERLLSIGDVFESAHPAVLIWLWTWLPFGRAITLGIDSFAGERERHTLETLLATRLPEGSILLGKIVATVSYGWLSAMAMALGVLVAINVANVPDGGIFIYPTEVLLVAPVTSLLFAITGASAAVLISLRAPTVSHANTRLLMLASILPVIIMLALLLIGVVVIAAVAIVVWVTGAGSLEMPDVGRRTAAIAGIAGGSLLYLGATAAIWAIARVRFRRWTMVDLAPPGRRWFGRSSDDESPPPEAVEGSAELAPGRLPWISAAGSTSNMVQSLAREAPLQTVLRDAGVVAWKEWREFLALYREWRGWFWFGAAILAWLTFQMSAAASTYWAESSDFSLVWWLAMAGAMPLVVSQRIADSIAGERERRTGEVLFTTRLSSLGILLGKLAGATVAPWLITLGIPLAGLLTVNLVQSGGPFRYPAGVLVAGVTFTAASALLMACLGVLISMRAATVQDAARRMSWLALPYALVPAFGLRRMASNSDDGDTGLTDTLIAKPPDILMNGDLITPIQIAGGAMLLLSALLLVLIIRQFQRGTLDLG